MVTMAVDKPSLAGIMPVWDYLLLARSKWTEHSAFGVAETCAITSHRSEQVRCRLRADRLVSHFSSPAQTPEKSKERRPILRKFERRAGDSNSNASQRLRFIRPLLAPARRPPIERGRGSESNVVLDTA